MGYGFYLKFFIAATPYAGITRVRFKGYNLSHQWHPCYQIYYINPQKAMRLIIIEKSYRISEYLQLALITIKNNAVLSLILFSAYIND